MTNPRTSEKECPKAQAALVKNLARSERAGNDTHDITALLLATVEVL